MKALVLFCLIASPASSKELLFEPNQGQASVLAEFLARTDSYTLLLNASNATFVFKKAPAISLNFIGSDRTAKLTGSAPSSAKINYFSGADERAWKRNISTYRKVRCASLYPGIDIVFYGSGNQLEYDFIVQPGVDPGAIRFRFNSALKPSIASSGDLVIRHAGGELRLHHPVLYQSTSNRVHAEYMLHSDGTIGFDIGSFDRTKTLVIDPVVTYSSYLGGTDDEGIFGIRRDNEGNIYIAGETSSLDFPALNAFQPNVGGSYDAFVSKFDPTGAHLIYSTYLGGSGYDHSVGLSVDERGDAYLAGLTTSSNFPIKHPIQASLNGAQNAFIARLTRSGSDLVFSTYLGGGQYDEAQDIALDDKSDIYIVGSTNSPDFPITKGAFQTVCDGPEAFSPSFCNTDAFVTKIAGDGSKLLYSTFLGGNSYDEASGVAVDKTGAVYVTGQSSSHDFPLQNPYQPALAGQANAFVTKLLPVANTLEFSTYLGGSGYDSGNAIAVTPEGAVYLTGSTSSPNFPLVDAFQKANGGGFSDCFISKFSPNGAELLKSSYYGGSGFDYPFRLGLDIFGSVSVIGFTASTDLPIRDAIQSNFAGGNSDAFVLKLLPVTFKPLYSTYLGGAGDEYGYGIYSESLGALWIGGSTSSTNYPVKDAFQTMYADGPYDAFLTRMGLTIPDYLRLLEDLLSGEKRCAAQVALAQLHFSNSDTSNALYDLKQLDDIIRHSGADAVLSPLQMQRALLASVQIQEALKQ